MSKRILIFMLTVILVGTFTLSSFQITEASDGQMIRIGVVPQAETIDIGSEESFVIKDKVTDEILAEGINDFATISLESSGTIETNYRLQVAWTTSEPYMNDWLDRASNAGYETYIEPYNNGYRLYIGEFPADASWSVRNAFRDEVIALGLAANDSFWKLITISTGTSSMKVSYNGEHTVTENPVVISSEDGLIEINGKKYRGNGEVAYNSKGTLAGINELPVEQYLYGVVPRELPPVPYGEMEAQKAQAVAARTYTLANLGKRSNDGYDLLPTTSDQVYAGYEAEHPISTQAIKETEGTVATHNGKLITAVYHSTSGGVTANNEDVWDSEPVDYLRGVPVFDLDGKSRKKAPSMDSFINDKNATSLRKMDGYEEDWSKYYRWQFEWTAEEISEVLSEYYKTDVGEVYEINVLERANYGRILEIEYVTENGIFYEQKDRVRWSLKYINAKGEHSVLLSTLFFILPTHSGGFKAYGGGWGHGVGMSQTGAVGMAYDGDTFDEILKHFYQGIELEVRY
ncbi:SpoIID/LytB domain-containing protein [Pseudalkalibacillus decolorationis]|uniref:SpoIID/LytB domain-containing protein n=1 Tax=Pseudalkalibacillus decolorationis TaxID=163879 RepID=UPI002148B5DA|nr:SpoIID/LytB domain-containing protein [Pseudalkalibacillus decolorationis]